MLQCLIWTVMTFKPHHKHLAGRFNYPFVPSHQEDTKPRPVEPTDAAALIAQALKRKFSHRHRNDSECDANFNLPAPENNTHVETPPVREILFLEKNYLSRILFQCHSHFVPFLLQFGQHMLKSNGRRKLCQDGATHLSRFMQ